MLTFTDDFYSKILQSNNELQEQLKNFNINTMYVDIDELVRIDDENSSKKY